MLELNVLLFVTILTSSLVLATRQGDRKSKEFERNKEMMQTEIPSQARVRDLLREIEMI